MYTSILTRQVRLHAFKLIEYQIKLFSLYVLHQALLLLLHVASQRDRTLLLTTVTRCIASNPWLAYSCHAAHHCESDCS